TRGRTSSWGRHPSASESEAHEEVPVLAEEKVSSADALDRTDNETHCTTIAGGCNKVSFTEMMDVHDDNSVAQIQLVRRRARKLAKREQVKRARARRRSTEREADEELQRVAEEQDGNKSLKLLWKKWRSDSLNGETSDQ
ncbi:hypothetical protein PC115_g24000, partial [Phytophthora cactorum]